MPDLRLADPDGVVHVVPEADVPAALQSGWRAESQTDIASDTAAEARRIDYGGAGGAVKAALYGAARGATLGASDVAARVLGANPKDLSGLRAENPGISAGAEFAGTLLPAVVAPESLLGRAPAGALSRVAMDGLEAGKALGGIRGAATTLGASGLEGAGQAAGSYLSDIALGDRKLSAEGLAGALGGGFVFGAAGGGVALGVEKGAIAARRLFAHVADGGAKAANEAKQAWRTQFQSTLEAHDAAVDAAKAQLASARVTREQAGLARDRASAATAEIRAMAPELDAAHAAATGLDQKITTIEAAAYPSVVAGGIDDLDRLVSEHADARAEMDDVLRRIDTPYAPTPGVPVDEFGPRRAGRIDPDELQPVTAPAEATRALRKSDAPAPLSNDEYETYKKSYSHAASDHYQYEIFYSKGGDELVNPELRSGKSLTPEAAKLRDGLDLAFSMPESRLPRKVTIYRGMSDDPIMGQVGNRKRFENIKIGDVLEDPAFTSTAFSENAKSRNEHIVFTINAPAGTPALPIRSQFSGEGELLLPRNTKFRVDKIEYVPVSERWNMPEKFEILTDKSVRMFEKDGSESIRAPIKDIHVTVIGEHAPATAPRPPRVDLSAPIDRLSLRQLGEYQDELNKAFDSVSHGSPEYLELSKKWDDSAARNIALSDGTTKAPDREYVPSDTVKSTSYKSTNSLIADHAMADDLPPVAANTRRLFRASRRGDIGSGAHLTPDIDAATAYLDNPGFGGSQLHAYDVEPDNLLDLYKYGKRHPKHVLEKLAEELDYADPAATADTWSGNGLKHVFQVLENDTEAHIRSKKFYDWITFEDQFPSGAQTWKYLGDESLPATHSLNRPPTSGGDLESSPLGIKSMLDDGVDIGKLEGPARTDSLTGLLRGTQEKLAAGESINAIGAQGRGDYVAAKAAKRQEWRERNAPMAREEYAANAETRPGGVVDDIAAAAPAITKYERKSAELVEALGEAAPPIAKEQAAAFRAAENEADRKMMDRATRAVDDHVDRRPSANPSAKERIAAAKQDQLTADAVYKRARAAETEAKIGAKRATEARDAIPSMPTVPTGASAAPPSLLGNVATAVGVAGELGVLGIPSARDIPVVGPMLSMYIKYRALKATVGRFVGRVSATGDSRAASLVARTKDRIATAIDRSLGIVADTAPKTRGALVASGAAVSKRIFDDGEPDADKDATPQQHAAVRIREIIAATTRPELVSALVRREMHSVADPDLLAAVEQYLIARFSHLADVVQKPPPDNEYAKRPWVPSIAATHELDQRLAVIHDPEHALADGMRSPAARDTFRTAYPLLYELAKQRLIARVGDLKEPMPREARLRASALFQLPIDISLDPSHISIVRQPAKPDQSSTPIQAPDLSQMYNPQNNRTR